MSQPAPQRPVRWRSVLLLLALLAVPGPVASRDPTGAGARAGAAAPPERPLPLTVRPRGVRSVRLTHDPAAAETERYLYDVVWRDGRRERLTPDEFAALLYHEFSGRNRLFAFLNITSAVGIAWVGLGLLGQVLFAGRMLVQWITSERERRSVVPVAFWWMSLAGAALLVVYFVWRKDVIGVLGQSTGFLVYARNLRLIHRERGSL
jgi:lipid-A-disaccharide synthase-like uncharacterized protein